MGSRRRYCLSITVVPILACRPFGHASRCPVWAASLVPSSAACRVVVAAAGVVPASPPPPDDVFVCDTPNPTESARASPATSPTPASELRPCLVPASRAPCSASDRAFAPAPQPPSRPACEPPRAAPHRLPPPPSSRSFERSHITTEPDRLSRPTRRARANTSCCRRRRYRAHRVPRHAPAATASFGPVPQHQPRFSCHASAEPSSLLVARLPAGSRPRHVPAYGPPDPMPPLSATAPSSSAPPSGSPAAPGRSVPAAVHQ